MLVCSFNELFTPAKLKVPIFQQWNMVKTRFKTVMFKKINYISWEIWGGELIGAGVLITLCWYCRKFYPPRHPNLGLQLMKLGKIQLYLGQLLEASQYLHQVSCWDIDFIVMWNICWTITMTNISMPPPSRRGQNDVIFYCLIYLYIYKIH